jgi:putative cell wall-binding protein
MSPTVDSAVQADGFRVYHLAGLDRFDTATKIADEIANRSGRLTTALIVNGFDFHDGLVAGAAALTASNPGPFTGGAGSAGAVLLTEGETVPDVTAHWLSSHAELTRYAIGAVAAKAVPTATPVFGTDYADTSRKVAERFYDHPAAIALASSANFPDALTGGAHAGAFDAPLLFTDPNTLPPTISDYLTGLKSAISIGFLYGGTAAISENVRTAAVQAIS